MIRAASVIEGPAAAVRGRRCAVIGDGPTLTHGGMAFGAGTLFVQRNGGELVDPRPFLCGSLRATLQQYPHLGREIPAMGYSAQQIADLAASIDAVPADVVVDGSPADLGRVLRCNKPIVNVRYELDDQSARRLVAAIDAVRVV